CVSARRAGGQGFEPWRDFAAPSGFQDRRLRPLGHPPAASVAAAYWVVIADGRGSCSLAYTRSGGWNSATRVRARYALKSRYSHAGPIRSICRFDQKKISRRSSHTVAYLRCGKYLAESWSNSTEASRRSLAT